VKYLCPVLFLTSLFLLFDFVVGARTWLLEELNKMALASG